MQCGTAALLAAPCPRSSHWPGRARVPARAMDLSVRGAFGHVSEDKPELLRLSLGAHCCYPRPGAVTGPRPARSGGVLPVRAAGPALSRRLGRTQGAGVPACALSQTCARARAAGTSLQRAVLGAVLCTLAQVPLAVRGLPPPARPAAGAAASRHAQGVGGSSSVCRPQSAALSSAWTGCCTRARRTASTPSKRAHLPPARQSAAHRVLPQLRRIGLREERNRAAGVSAARPSVRPSVRVGFL
jgi:hypothetical protein